MILISIEAKFTRKSLSKYIYQEITLKNNKKLTLCINDANVVQFKVTVMIKFANIFTAINSKINLLVRIKQYAVCFPSEHTLSSEQCLVIRKFARVFEMINPVNWVRDNCPLAKKYFPRASCEHVQLQKSVKFIKLTSKQIKIIKVY
ncbi:unnamed protein product [Thelazia callipaeda]|uniref:aECM cysteine-cradle domain-containing protein n=1 Tax=Thelazia callipaeda TaxID=103827 RepID=A0A3P7KVU4_THECL|nr:unnamed protein product [Thelazia callipaeda]